MVKSHFIPLHIVFPSKERQRLLSVLFSALGDKKYFDHIHAVHKEGVSGICVHYDSTAIDSDEIMRVVKEVGAQIVNGYKQQSIRLYGMYSDDCAASIERKLLSINGVYNSAVSFEKSRLFIEYDSDTVALDDIHVLLQNLGYNGKKQNKSAILFLDNKQLACSFIVGLALSIAGYGYYILENEFLSNLSLIIVYVFGFYPLLKHTIKAILAFRVNVDVLMLLAAMGTVFLGKWFEGGLLLFLFSLGHGLEYMAMDRAKSAVRNLTKIVPKYASLKNGDNIQSRLVSDLEIGDIVVVKAGEMVPCDGTVISGSSTIDQSSITGESMPCDKTVGDDVFAGTINGSGILHIEVKKLSSDSTLSKMINIIVSADAEKSQSQNFTDKFAKIFVPTILLFVSMIVLVPPLLFGIDWHDSLYKAIICLVAASPCALVIAAPAAVLSAVARSAKLGAIVKGGVHLERLSMINALAIDKTGTITTGEPEVHSVIPFIKISEEEILQLAASVEQSCFHPLARAIVHRSQQLGLELDIVNDAVEVFGKGMKAVISDSNIVVGSIMLLPNVCDDVKARYKEIQQLGLTTVVVARDEQILGVITISDSIRENAKEFMGMLSRSGVRETVMLTGDNASVAALVANEVGITKVSSDLLPEDKVGEIARLKELYDGKVAMLGDGVNDAPAMSSALVGIAMGGAGSDAALDVADIVLMQDNLLLLPEMIMLSKCTVRVIKQNIFYALASISFLVSAAVFGVINLATAVFMHESMSVLVVLNGLRMLRFRSNFSN